jgi:hypothetical protein
MGAVAGDLRLPFSLFYGVFADHTRPEGDRPPRDGGKSLFGKTSIHYHEVEVDRGTPCRIRTKHTALNARAAKR